MVSTPEGEKTAPRKESTSSSEYSYDEESESNDVGYGKIKKRAKAQAKGRCGRKDGGYEGDREADGNFARGYERVGVGGGERRRWNCMRNINK